MRTAVILLVCLLAGAVAGVDVSMSYLSGSTCVEVVADQCYPYDCAGANGSAFMCDDTGFCKMYDDSSCTSTNSQSVPTHIIPCEVLNDSCAVSLSANPVLLLEVNVANATLVAEIDGGFDQGALMISPNTAVLRGVLSAVEFESSDGYTLRFLGLSADKPGYYNSTMGQFPLGSWIGDDAFSFRVSNVTGEENPGGYVVLTTSVLLLLDRRYTVSTSANHQLFKSGRHVYVDPNTLLALSLNIALGEPFYDESGIFPPVPAYITDMSIDQKTGYLHYTLAVTGEEPMDRSIRCYLETGEGLATHVWNCDDRLLSGAY